eukprot:TRINITY_DN1443_c0_g1_i1.p1 TRINITY_DN1443_c0_g1~~TRINITY_DN1443_c0_g1_i1.p1  ORF type:complete len:191 (-),score=26.46 TRINITY_DN1443_c0_g1_i1:205-777(-)
MSEWYIQGFDDNYKNGRGIPRAPFVEDVGAFLKQKDVSPDSALKILREQYSKYKLMDYKLGQNKSSLKVKVPEIKKTLEMVQHLKAKMEADEVLETYFGLSETVFANAVIKDNPKTVGLWLGANVMVEYSFDEAITLLQSNLKTATHNLAQTLEDLAWLRDQLTVTEVNISRVYNYDVKLRRKSKEAEKS